jgi:hypothetical protein
MPVTQAELDALPKDTTFGRKRYLGQNGLNVVQASVVLMGSDRTSIHDPQYCLEAASWHIEKTDPVLLPMDRPHSYEVAGAEVDDFHDGLRRIQTADPSSRDLCVLVRHGRQAYIGPGSALVVVSPDDVGEKGVGAVGVYFIFCDLPSRTGRSHI